MRRLTYWVMEARNDSSAYNVRARTKRDALKEAVKRFGNDWPEEYGDPKKVVVSYEAPFDLLEACLSPGAGYWERVRPTCYCSACDAGTPDADNGKCSTCGAPR